MATVDIEGVDYFAYADLETADAYLNGEFGDRADAWRDAEVIDQKRALVSGTRVIDGKGWLGTKTDPDQPGAFPRTGLFYADGTPVPDDEVPVEVTNASIELAAMLNNGEEINPAAGRTTTARRLKAGSVEIENFRQFGPVGTLPNSILAALGLWLSGSGGAGLAGSEAYGTCGKSAFREPQYKPSRGF